ncbi:MAG TPA: hypothetical protein VFW44_18990 [Bryobacteraceae bacterium]|nr:hypothetical protein [Bryobacteraceae bacterium]
MRKLFARDVYIRLSDSEPGIVCTVKRRGLLSRFPRLASKTTLFDLHAKSVRETEEDKALLPIKRWLAQPEDQRHPMGS